MVLFSMFAAVDNLGHMEAVSLMGIWIFEQFDKCTLIEWSCNEFGQEGE